MKRILINLLNLFLAIPALLAQQPSQAEMDKAMKVAQEAMKKYGSAIKTQLVENAGAGSGSGYTDPSDYGNVDNWRFPAKNAGLLSSLPKKIFSRAELVSFLNGLYSELSKKLPAGIGPSVQAISTRYNNDGSKMGDAAVLGWYTNYREESLLLIIRAAANDPDDGVLLNNCAALLNMGGIEQKAIPILKYILQSYPGNAMVLNNLGEAYAGLGETDTAMVYLGRCLKTEPENPEANNTAGQIEATKGNTESAIHYFEQSIKSAYNKPAELKLRKIKKGENIVPLVRPRIKLPDYFNQFKYKLPAQCTSTDQAAVADAEYKAFRNVLAAQIEVYYRKLYELQQKLAQNPMPDNVQDKKSYLSQPFYEFCGIMARDVLKDFYDNLGSYDKKFTSDYADLDNEYKGKLKPINDEFVKRELQCCGEGKGDCCPTQEEKCNARNELANQYLPKFAAITGDWQEKNQLYFRTLFDELVYWNYLHLHPLGDDYFRVQCFYPLVTAYLGMLAKVGVTRIIEPCDFQPTTATMDSVAIKEMDCPLNIQIPFVVGKIQLTCDKISISGGEGAVFAYEKNFKTHQSTVSVGIGAKLELEVKAGLLKAGVSAGATETAFITFDGNNGIADAGITNRAGVSAGATGAGKEESSVGSTIGINSGWNFDEGPFKGMIGPGPETQQNKNVNVYKSRN
jgi:tetratricopeptide (TPR) repeat protein